MPITGGTAMGGQYSKGTVGDQQSESNADRMLRMTLAQMGDQRNAEAIKAQERMFGQQLGFSREELGSRQGMFGQTMDADRAKTEGGWAMQKYGMDRGESMLDKQLGAQLGMQDRGLTAQQKALETQMGPENMRAGIDRLKYNRIIEREDADPTYRANKAMGDALFAKPQPEVWDYSDAQNPPRLVSGGAKSDNFKETYGLDRAEAMRKFAGLGDSVDAQVAKAMTAAAGERKVAEVKDPLFKQKETAEKRSFAKEQVQGDIDAIESFVKSQTVMSSGDISNLQTKVAEIAETANGLGLDPSEKKFIQSKLKAAIAKAMENWTFSRGATERATMDTVNQGWE